jgi:hypothetical protein
MPPVRTVAAVMELIPESTGRRDGSPESLVLQFNGFHYSPVRDRKDHTRSSRRTRTVLDTKSLWGDVPGPLGRLREVSTARDEPGQL